MFKKILVTGADGFIGSHVVELLVEQGYSPRAMVLYNSFGSQGWLDNLDPKIKAQVEIIWGDVRDPSSARKAVLGCDAVLHLAALIGIPYSYENPDSYVQTNVVGTLNILQAAREFSTQKVIHTSTSEVYGTAQYVPISEAHPLVAQSPYAASKIAADQLALSFYRSFDLPVAVIRPFNTYGPRQSLRAVIPTIINQLLQGKRKIRLGALTPTRDFSFVKDTASGFIAALESDKILGEVVNLGSGFEISIADTVGAISDVMNVEIDVDVASQCLRPEKSEVNRLYADTAKAASFLDWSPQYTGLTGFKRGLEATVNWFAKHNTLDCYVKDEHMV